MSLVRTRHLGAKKNRHSYFLNNNTGNSVPQGTASVVWGVGLISNTSEQGVYGRYNKPDERAIFIVGAGVNEDNRANAIVVKENGRVQNYGGEIYAEINGICTPVLAELNDNLQPIYMEDGE